MKYIYKLPILLSIFSAIIAAVIGLYNGKDVTLMAYEVCAVIVVAYIAGLILKSVIIRIIKEVLVKKYLKEEKERQARRKAMESEGPRIRELV